MPVALDMAAVYKSRNYSSVSLSLAVPAFLKGCADDIYPPRRIAQDSDAQFKGRDEMRWNERQGAARMG
jgi:hypothetical protein